MQHLSRFFSFPVMGILMIIFAISIACATFIENDFGTQTAWAVVYASRWFEVLLFLLALNLLGIIIKAKMWQKEKWGIALFHSSLILILLGAAITRYVGYEGVMHIRTNEVENRILSAQTYITVETNSTHHESPIFLSALGENTFHTTAQLPQGDAEITLKKTILKAKKTVKEDPNGKAIIHLVASENQAPMDVLLTQGDVFDTGSTLLAFDTNVSSHVKKIITITSTPKGFILSSPLEAQTLLMATQKTLTYQPKEAINFTKGKLYTTGSLSLVVKEMIPHGKIDIIPSDAPTMNKESSESALIFDVTYKGKTQELTVMGAKSALADPSTLILDGTPLHIGYGSKIITLPFALRLEKFTMQRYAGSMSPSSYESKVSVINDQKPLFTYDIFMNHVLDYEGFRFFQSSYDGDEMGTILSVSSDPGKLPTYIGYFLLALGLFSSLVMKNGRFRQLSHALKGSLSIALVLMTTVASHTSYAATTPQEAQQMVTTLQSFDTQASEQFGNLLVQDPQGRIKPINTLSIEVLNKVSKTDSLLGLSADQVILGMLVRPRMWQDIEMIKIAHPEILKLLGLPATTQRATFNDFFDYTKESSYKLKELVEQANAKRPAIRSKLENELIKVDERVNVCYMVYNGELFRLFPKPADTNNSWVSPTDAIATFPQKESQVVRMILQNYFSTIDTALQTHQWNDVLKGGELLNQYQKAYGAAVIPDEMKIRAELVYNNAHLFDRLAIVYILGGMILFVIAFMRILKPSFHANIAVKTTSYIIIAAFVLHTLGLLLRWYISGHAPWSDGYESMIYIAWATILAGFYFAKYSQISMALTAVLSSLTLFVAHMGWMDPQITNLVPVLKSYWLNIHVSMITGSYGFLALGALLGFTTLILFALRHSSKPHLDEAIVKLTTINEMTLIIGLMMLTVGNFLGGVWANESWGRYWGWDPKETWALVSIIIYGVVTHFRFIPGLKSTFAFATASVVAFSTIIMTYFGVNYYLSGMHSYAAGDPVPVPSFVYYTIAVICLGIVFAYPKRNLSEDGAK